MSQSEKIKPKQRFKVYDTFMLRAILGSDSTDSQEDAASSAGAGSNSGGGGSVGSAGSGKNTNSPATGSASSKGSGTIVSSSGRLANSFCRGGCSRSISSSAVLNNSNYDYGTPATVAPSTSTHSGSGCIACEADKHYQQQHYHTDSSTSGERKSRRSFATRSSCSKMSHSSSSSMRGSSRSCMSNNSKSVSPGSYSCNALNVDFSTYTATHQWTKMLECAEFVGAKYV